MLSWGRIGDPNKSVVNESVSDAMCLMSALAARGADSGADIIRDI